MNTKKRKCLEVCVNGRRYVCYEEADRGFPFRLYHKWYDDRWHTKLVGDFTNICEVFQFLQYKY